jgi:hypothetical protein
MSELDNVIMIGKLTHMHSEAIKERDELQRELDSEDEQMVMQIIILREELEVAMKEVRFLRAKHVTPYCINCEKTAIERNEAIRKYERYKIHADRAIKKLLSKRDLWVSENTRLEESRRKLKEELDKLKK